MTAKKKTRPFRARVTVLPRRVVLDPEGKAIGATLARLGFDQVREVRAGKSFTLELEAADAKAAEKAVGEMCRKLLANPLLEDWSVELEQGGEAADGGAS